LTADRYLDEFLIRHLGPIFQDVDPILLFIVLLLMLILVLTICIGGSYCIARARWREPMELRERHSPSRDQK
jgi:hypothetical protein